MNNFGLGLILTFTDNATSGLQRATGAFNDLNATTAAFSNANGAEAALLQVSYAAGIVGDQLYQVGESITGMFANVTKSIVNTGTTILTAKTQLGTLYGSMEEGAAKLEEIKDYASKSIFNFEDLIPSVIMLKANGIEAFDQIATSAYKATNGLEGTSQTLMDYASDLAAFNPQMRNSYGTGVQAAMGALNEYIAEGNAVSLKRGASLDINSLIGEETAGTIEERSRQVADLIEKLGMVGTTANLASTPMQRLSNVEDVLFNTTAEIANSGVYDKYSELIAKLTDYVFSIPESELTNIANVIGEALVEILDLLDPVVDGVIKLADALRDFLKTNPELAQSIIKGIALAGVFALLSGAGLKLMSSLGMLRFSLSSLFGGKLAANGLSLLGLFKNLLVGVLPLIAASALLKAAWDRDFMGIQETVTGSIQKILDSVRLIADAFMDNTLSAENFQKAKDMGILPLIEGILQLKYHWQFFVEGFKRGLDAFFDSLSKVLIKLGILDVDVSGLGDLVVALIDKMTAPGMTDTWEQVGYLIGESVGWILAAIAILPTVVKFVSAIVKTVMGIIKAVKAVISVVKAIINIVKIVWNLLRVVYYSVKWIVVAVQSLNWSAILSGAGAVFEAIGQGIIFVLSLIGEVVIAILGAFGIAVTLPAWVVGLIVVAVIALITLIIVFWDEIKAFFISLGTIIAEAFQSAWEWFSSLPWVQSVIGFVQGIIQTVQNAIHTVFSAIQGVIASIINALMPIITPIVAIIRTIVSTIVSVAQSIWSIIQSIGSAIATVVMGIIDIVKAVASAIWQVCLSIFNVIKSIVMGVWSIIQSIAGFIQSVFNVIYQAIRVIVLSIIWVFQQLWNGISTGLNFIWGLFTTVFGWIYSNIIQPVVQAIGAAFDWVYNTIISPVIQAIGAAFEWLQTNVITPVCDFFKAAFEKIADVVDTLVDKFNTAFTAIKDFICNAIQAAADFVTPIIDGIASAIQWVADAISSVIDAASGAIGWVGDKLSSAGDAIQSAVGLSTGGYVKTAGIAMLHPNEVVVNDVLTRGLGSFLEDYNRAKLTSSPLIKQDVVATDDYTEDDNPLNPDDTVTPQPSDDDNNSNSPMRTLTDNSTTYNGDTDNRTTTTSQDNSVTFESGSVVIQIDKDTDLTDEGLDIVVDKLMKKMARKLQLRNMQTRN